MAEAKHPAPDEQAVTSGDGDASVEEVLDLLRRERADFINYKRRIERERADDQERIRADMVQRLLPLLDDLERALTDIPDDLIGHPWVQGTALTRNELTETLSELGLERIGAVGEPFDPAQHEALFFDTHPDVTERTVGEVVRPGYRLGGHLLRPARVSVFGPVEQARPVEESSEDKPQSDKSGARKTNRRRTRGG